MLRDSLVGVLRRRASLVGVLRRASLVCVPQCRLRYSVRVGVRVRRLRYSQVQVGVLRATESLRLVDVTVLLNDS